MVREVRGRGVWQGGQEYRTLHLLCPQNLKKDIRGVLDQMEDIQLEILG